MLLRNVQTVYDNKPIDIRIEGGTIVSITDANNDTTADSIDLNNAIAIPGLINSHDHLDFNLFPRIGNRIYKNYVEWGTDIHLNNKDIINEVQKIPVALRTAWGVYKNLLCGVTTVVNHGVQLVVTDELINVFQDSYVLHSPGFEKGLFLKLNTPFAKGIVNIHVGEGTDEQAHAEITKLLKWNIFKKKLVGIHGIAMDEEQARGFEALIWCPDSNYFLTGETAAVGQLKNYTTILFGTDATLTASWNIWEHIRLARKTGMLTEAELFNSLTHSAANAWGLGHTGQLKEGYAADIVVVKPKNETTGFEAIYATNPEDIQLVLHKGQIRLFDEELKKQLASSNFSKFSKITMNEKNMYIMGDLPTLMQQIKSYYPKAVLPVN